MRRAAHNRLVNTSLPRVYVMLFAGVGWLWSAVAAGAAGLAVAVPADREAAIFWAVLGAAMGPCWILYARSGRRAAVTDVADVADLAA
jgi:hypothetical protein